MNQSREGLLLVVSGPAGVGKGTLDKALLERHQDMKLSVSATTRAPRPGEIDGVHSFFKTEEEFKAMIHACISDQLLRHAPQLCRGTVEPRHRCDFGD